MDFRTAIFAALSIMMLSGCERAGGNIWKNIDYAQIARENYRLENDSYYVPPHIFGCLDNDITHCTAIDRAHLYH
jgi:hypothetical protein